MYNTKIIKCLACDKDDSLESVLNFGNQPLVNNLTTAESINDPTYPVILNYCYSCGHLQLDSAVDPDELFRHYLYLSGATESQHRYASFFSTKVAKTIELATEVSVLDVACNDGTQLDYFKKMGFDTYGVDPSKNLFEISSKNHKIICNYFSYEVASKFSVKFDVIIAQNVFAHIIDPLEFLFDAHRLLKQNGYLFIQLSQSNMLNEGQFDTIYHEHLSFFSPYSFSKLVERSPFQITNYEIVDIHGYSDLFTLTIKDDNSITYGSKVTRTEIDSFVTKVNLSILQFVEDIENARSNDFLVVGYGAAAKGITLVNYCKLKLDLIVDNNPLKQNKYTSFYNTSIVSPTGAISNKGRVAWVILAWNYRDEIIAELKNKRDLDADLIIDVPFRT